jgi:hypothetical protein
MPLIPGAAPVNPTHAMTRSFSELTKNLSPERPSSKNKQQMVEA